MSTCQILNIIQSGEQVNINFVSQQDLSGAKIRIYDFDFITGEYKEEPMMEAALNAMSTSPLRYRISGSHKLKCVIVKNDEVLATRESYVGNRHKITVRTEKIEIGRLYTLISDVSVSKELIYYNAEFSGTKITLPSNLYAGDKLLFVIKEKNFTPQFKFDEKIAQCFTIEY